MKRRKKRSGCYLLAAAAEAAAEGEEDMDEVDEEVSTTATDEAQRRLQATTSKENRHRETMMSRWTKNSTAVLSAARADTGSVSVRIDVGGNTCYRCGDSAHQMRDCKTDLATVKKNENGSTAAAYRLVEDQEYDEQDVRF